MKLLSSLASLVAAALLAACSSDPAVKDPPKSESLPPPSPEQQKELKQAERLFLERKPEWTALRDRLARDPTTGPQLLRMLIYHAVQSFRNEPPHGDDLGLALAGITPETLFSRCMAEFHALGPLAVERVFDDLVSHRSTENRQVGLLAMTAIGPAAAPRLRREASHAESLEVRRAAIQGLGAFAADPAVAADLCRLAVDREWQIRGQALASLGYATDSGSGQVLLQAARGDRDLFVRRKAIQALGVRATPEAASALLEVLDQGVVQKSAEVCNEAQTALRRITHKDFGWKVDAWRSWLETHPASRPAASSETEAR